MLQWLLKRELSQCKFNLLSLTTDIEYTSISDCEAAPLISLYEKEIKRKRALECLIN